VKTYTGDDMVTGIDDMKVKLAKELTVKRYKHSINVMETSAELAGIYGCDVKKAVVAGLLHDCARELNVKEMLEICENNNIPLDEISKLQPELLHGKVGSYVAEKEYGVNDSEILNAISCHTTGKENMNMLEKIIFIADYIEPGRNFPGVDEIRSLAYEDIDKAIIASMENTMIYVIQKGALLHKDMLDARNFIIMDKRYRSKVLL